MKKTFFIRAIVFVLIILYGFSVFKKEETEIPENSLIIVNIEGAIKIPGEYSVSFNTNLGELINYAGGLKDNANIKNIDIKQYLSNDKHYYIPEIEEKNNPPLDQELVNINKANKEQLMTLPGIGEAKALAIIEYRVK